jgi:peptide-methionine (R)-S-oxide reductase
MTASSFTGPRATRRAFLMASAALGAVAAAGRAFASGGDTVTIATFTDAGVATGTRTVPKVVKTAEEWQAQLSPLAYEVTRQEGTEYAFSGEYWDMHEDGIFRCICCDNALFDSKTKYDSGTGWPSFWEPIAAGNVIEHRDTSYGMVRTAISCTLCDAHLGHVFPDGPQPTGLRYCMNSVALRFIARPSA